MGNSIGNPQLDEHDSQSGDSKPAELRRFGQSALENDVALSDDAATEHLCTPAMLAEILEVSVRTVRRWQQAGLLDPATEVMQLPHFGYAELTTAKQLARWMRQGLSVRAIEQQLRGIRQRIEAELSKDSISDAAIPSMKELISQWPISADGRKLVLRQGDSFVEASGQLRLEFESRESNSGRELLQSTIPFQRPDASETGLRNNTYSSEHTALTLDEMISEAIEAEDADEFESAIDWYRAALAAYGPNSDVCFQIAELLYRQGDLTGARERYFIALELNPAQVEARANLGCVLAECGQTDLAIAAFQGALDQYADYADVHFHLARALDDSGSDIKAAEHWVRFLELAPESPWAEEAKQRLHQNAPMLEL